MKRVKTGADILGGGAGGVRRDQKHNLSSTTGTDTSNEDKDNVDIH